MSAPELVVEIMRALKSRGGFDSWWDTIDEDIQEEILEELYEIASDWMS